MIRLFSLNISQVNDEQYEACYHKACEERRKQADRYRFAEDKKRCIFSEVLLRYAYARSGGDLGSMKIVYPKNEKPYLASDKNFHFNLSHSGEMIALACGADAVGIDIEKTDRTIDREQIEDMIFTDEEKNWLAGAEDMQEQNERFFRLWTAKESYLKYLGTGFAKSAKSFSVDMKRHCLCGDAEGSIFFTEMIPSDGYVLTVCGTSGQTEYESLTFSDLKADSNDGRKEIYL